MNRLKNLMAISLVISFCFITSYVSRAAYGDALTLYGPKDGSSVAATQPTLKWNAFTGAAAYDIKYATTYAGLNGATPTDVGNVTQWQVGTPLTNDQTYYWQAKSNNSGYSSARWFKVDTSLANSQVKIDSITGVRTVGVAGGDFSNGWHFRYKVTVYGAENQFQFKLDDWTRNGGGTMLTANNAQVSYDGTDKTLAAADTYSTSFNITDEDDTVEGKQITINLYIKIPAGTAAGTYTTNYGIKSL